MSKLGKMNILIPQDVNVVFSNGFIDIKGPNGSKKLDLDSNLFDITINKNKDISIKPKKINQSTKRLWGMNRSLINNAIIGVKQGFEKTLELTGVGLRAAIQGNKLNLQLGFSHPVNYEIPKDIKITVEKQTTIKISGSDKQLVGMICANLKALKPVEPYKGKGIKEKGQYVLRKEGKKK